MLFLTFVTAAAATATGAAVVAALQTDEKL